MQTLPGQECPHVNIDCKFKVIIMTFECPRFGNKGWFAIVAMNEFGHTIEDGL